MVDLVKIRKKAREKKEAAAGEMLQKSAESQTPAKAKQPKNTKGKPKTSRTATGKSRKKTPSKKRGSSKQAQTPDATDEQKKASVGNDATGDELVRENAGAVRVDAGGESKLSRFKRTAGLVEYQETRPIADQADVDEDHLELITFSLAGEQYAIDVDRVVEIIVPRAWTRVPNTAESVIGIISLRGSIVTLLDLRDILGHPGRDTAGEETRIVVVQQENEQVGFIVDRVLRVVKVDRGIIEPPPVVSAAEQSEAVHGVFVSGDTITIYLDLERIAG